MCSGALLFRTTFAVGCISKTRPLEMFSQPTVTSAQTEDGGLGPPVEGGSLVFLWVILSEPLFL